MEKEKKVSEYITQTEAYQFGKKNAIRLVQSKQQADVALGARYLLDIYKYSYLEIAQFILDSYDIVSLDCITKATPKILFNVNGFNLDITLPNSIMTIKSIPIYSRQDDVVVIDWISIDIQIKHEDNIVSKCTLNFDQNITFYALIEDELHKYLKKSLL